MKFSDNQPITIDPELITRLKQKDESALVQLIQEQKSLLNYWAFQILKNNEDADEATNNAFHQVWEKICDYDPEKGGFAIWVKSIVRHSAIDKFRKNLRHWKKLIKLSVVETQREIEAVTGDHLPDACSSLDDLHVRVTKLLETRLPKNQKEVLILCYFNGLSHTQIAFKTGEALGTIKARVRRGLKKLRKLASLDATFVIRNS